MLNAGTAFNVVPGRGELFCDLRADDDAAILAVLDAVPRESGGVALEPELTRLWPGMDAEVATAGLLRAARAARWAARSSACTAAARATRATSPRAIPLTVDGLGPRGGKAHNPGEFVLAESLLSRAEVALAVAAAAVAG